MSPRSTSPTIGETQWSAPSIDEVRGLRTRLSPWIVDTPTIEWKGPEIESAVAPHTRVFAKLELLQVTGTFKARGALANLLDLDEATRKRGVTAVSAGNHAIAVAYAASITGSSAKVVMPSSANPFRVERVQSYGGEVVLCETIAEAFDTVDRIEREEGRTSVHPFEGRNTVLGTATVGLDLCSQVEPLDAVIVPVGGGGLCAGIAFAVKDAWPHCQIYGVEPEGADSMSRSLAIGEPQRLDSVDTIADSLGAPYALPYSFELCREHVSAVIRLSDSALRDAMRFVFENLKLAVEPAGAAATAALLGPLQQTLAGKRVGLVVCGSNIDAHTFAQLIDVGDHS